MDLIMRIRELRRNADMNQQQLADAMGVAQNCVSQWETEVALPRTRQLPELAKVFGCSIDDLYTPEYRPDNSM